MDIRSIIDSEDTPPTRKTSVSVPARQEYRPNPAGFPNTQAPAYDKGRNVRPPQPTPLQTPSHNGSHIATASPHDSIRPPYQRTPSFGLNNGQNPPGQAPIQSPHHPRQASNYSQREGNSANGPLSGRSFGPSTPSQTPTVSTPSSTGAYSIFQRPTSSQSIPTPNSTQNSSGFLRESPQPSHPNSRALSQPQGTQQYTSQPGTPLGPPSTYNRPTFNTHRESSGAYPNHRSPSGGIGSRHETSGRSVGTHGSPPAYREPRPSVQGHSDSRNRERSLSVSPKTRLPSLPNSNRVDSMNSPPNPSSGWNGDVTPVKRNIESELPDSRRVSEPKLTRTPSRSFGLSDLLNAEPSSDTPETAYRASQTKSPSNVDQESDIEILDHDPTSKPPHRHSYSASEQAFQHSRDHSISHSSIPNETSTIAAFNQTAIQPLEVSTSTVTDQMAPKSVSRVHSQPEPPSSFKQAALKTSNGLINAPLPPAQKSFRAKKQAKRPMKEANQTEALGNDDILLSQPAKKKPRLGEPQHSVEQAPIEVTSSQGKKITVPRVSRYEDVPIFAHSVRGAQRTRELYESNRNGVRRDRSTAVQAPYRAATAGRSHDQANGESTANNPIPATNGTLLNDGILGPWEYSIKNIEPMDELVRVISDFLFIHVVVDDSVGVAPAGGGRGLGAIFEIEAKIGRVIDNNTNDRIRLPVESECVISRSDPSLKTRFESSMTQQQHSTLNKFLNDALVASQSPKPGAVPQRKPRIPMTYTHTHEVDTLYGLSQQGAFQLPRSFAQGKRQPKVRVTREDKTGDILAKIIKTPIADIHVHCPRSLFDWRISVNIEMDFNGDMADLVDIDKRDSMGDRKKDRMSYKHLQYQVDLTQVTSTEPENKARTHELEIEISSEEVRRQGRLVGQNRPNDYEKLIKGFVDNVRLLARHCVN